MNDLPHETPVVDEVTALVTNLQKTREQNGYSTAIWNDDRLTRAAQGLTDFKKLATSASVDLAGKVLNDEGIKMCFLGIVPVQHFDADLSQAEIDRFNDMFAMMGENYAVVSYRPALSDKKKHVLVNFKAAEAIMTEQSDLFLNINDRKAFLVNHPQDYLENARFLPSLVRNQRHGVLSGFPRKTVDLWSRTSEGLGRLKALTLNSFSAGNRDEGFAFSGYSEADRTWANEALALKKATGINEANPPQKS